MSSFSIPYITFSADLKFLACFGVFCSAWVLFCFYLKKLLTFSFGLGKLLLSSLVLLLPNSVPQNPYFVPLVPCSGTKDKRLATPFEVPFCPLFRRSMH
jgi:hypothetical protein